MEQAAFWHEVKALCCLLIPFCQVLTGTAVIFHSRLARPPICLSFIVIYNALSYFLHTIECSNDFGYCLIEIFRSYRHLIFSILFQKVKTYVMCAWIVWIRSLSPSNHPRSDHAPIVIVIQSEHLKHSISPRNQSAKHPDSGCFGISGVVIGSALSKGWRSGPEAFRAGHFLRLDRDWKPCMKSLWHPG